MFPFPDPKAYVETITRKSIPLIGNLLAVAHLALLEPKELKILKAIRGKSVASPLDIGYGSGSPFRLGPATAPEGSRSNTPPCHARRTAGFVVSRRRSTRRRAYSGAQRWAAVS